MGSACSEVDNEHNQTIKNDTATTSAEETPNIKFFLLGSKGSGKTTIWKHLKLLFCGGIQQDERENILLSIRNDLIYNMKYIIESGESKDHFYENKLQEYARDILELTIVGIDEALTPEIAHKIKALWDDPFTKIEYQNNIKTYLNDYAYFFFDKSELMAQNDYVLTDEDILKNYCTMREIESICLQIENKISALLFDCDHRKLTRNRFSRNILKTTEFLIFVVSLTDFCYFFGDEEPIRISENSISMFDYFANSDFFILKPILLIFNKKDLFERKLNDFADEFIKAYPEFNGDIKNANECIEYIKYFYLSKVSKDRKKEAWVETFIISAFDEKNCQELYRVIVSKISDHYF